MSRTPISLTSPTCRECAAAHGEVSTGVCIVTLEWEVAQRENGAMAALPMPASAVTKAKETV